MKIDQTLEGKRVKIICKDGETYEGHVTDFIFAEDNVPTEVEAIVLDYLVRKTDGYRYSNPVEFTKPEIESIEIID